MRYLTIIIACIGIAGVITLGVKLSSETLGLLAAAAIGIIGGVCGAVPVSIVLVWALIRRTQGGQQAQQAQQYPPVIVIGGNGQPMNLPGATPPPWESLPAPRREFKVVPDDGWEDA
jgi:hypothetical protein